MTTNIERAGFAKEALDTFIETTGVDKEDAVTDLLCDLRHLCDQDASYGDFREEAERAYRNYLSDLRDEEEAAAEGIPVETYQTGTQSDEKAVGVAYARRFMQELLDSVESLTAVAEEHGARTLADLMYLQNAILTGGLIDHYPDESAVLAIVESLPSGAQWTQFIQGAD